MPIALPSGAVATLVCPSLEALLSGDGTPASIAAASLEETAASLEEISSMTKRNAETAGTAKSLSAQARVTRGKY